MSEVADEPRRTDVEFSRRRFIAAGGAFAAIGLLHGGNVISADAMDEIDLRIARCRIEVANGHFIETTAYRDYLPGSVLKLPEGRTVRINIHNDSSNKEYVHWHGFSLEASLDGTAEEGSLAVESLSSLSYIFPPQRSGSYYVHTHAMAHQDLSAGMYGGQFAFVQVVPARDTGAYDREVFLTSHEWEPYMVNETQEEQAAERTHHLRMEAEAQDDPGEGGWDIRYRLASLNGKALGHGEPIRVRRGERILLHLLNASATENIQLALPGHEFLIRGMDGAPVPKPVAVPALDLGVGERIDAIVEMNSPGIWILGSTDEVVRNKGLGVVVEYAGAQGDPVWSEVEAPEWDYTLFADTGKERIAEDISVAISRLPLTEEGMERWKMTLRSGNGAHAAVLEQGRIYRLRIANHSNEWHPMHLHRCAFELTRFHGKTTAGLVKDTVVVPPYDEVEVRIAPQIAGPALFHCHNQMHMDSGLQALLNFIPSTT